MGVESAHAKLSPSSLDRVLTCPGSFQLYQKYPPAYREHPAAAEGTRAHELGEEVLNTGMDIESFTDDEDMIYFVQQYVDYCTETAKRNKDQDPYVEVKLDLTEFIPEAFGTADFISVDYVDKGWIDVIDLKYGKGVKVSPHDNPQLLTYGIGAAILLFGPSLKGFKGLRTHIFQPRMNNVDFSSYDFLEVIIWKDRISRGANDAWNGKMEFKETTKGCRFCDVKHLCPIKRNRALNEVLFAHLPTDESIPEVLDKRELVVDYMNAVVLRAKEIIENADEGEEVEGYVLESKRGRRVWKEGVTENDVTSILAKAVKGLELKDIVDSKLKSPTQVETVLKKFKVDKDTREMLMEQFVEKKDGTLTLVKKYLTE
jgi:signal recognition particle subunit SEC65